MIKAQVQGHLQSVYEKWKGGLDSNRIAVDDFSPPLLLSITDDYCRASVKIIVYGQETAGWDWTRDLQRKYPNYPVSWPFRDLRNFGDFLRNADSIEALCWAYDQFAFAKYQPENYRSPFWRAFRSIQEWPDVGVMHANLVRVDYNDGSIRYAEESAVEAMLRLQNMLIRAELEALSPTVCIFLTGPDYDFILTSAFPGLEMKQLGSAPCRELAKLVHSALPTHSCRTYHPNYLNQSGKWGYLDLIHASLPQ